MHPQHTLRTHEPWTAGGGDYTTGRRSCMLQSLSGAKSEYHLHHGGMTMPRGTILRALTALTLVLTLFGGALAPFATPGARAAATLTVTTTADSGAGSLRQAIIDAVAGDTIAFALPNPSTITLTGGELVIAKTLTIQGPGATALTISGGNVSRVFNITAGTVAIGGLTVTGGAADNGGGLFVGGGALTLTKSTVRNNTANGVGFGYGGGLVATSGGSISVVDSTVSNNTATFYGGLYVQGLGTLTMRGSTVSGNQATNGIGALGVATDGTGTVTNSTISGNQADAFTGGLYVQETARLTVVNSTVADNIVGASGRQLSNNTGVAANMTVRNTIVGSGTTPQNNCVGLIANGGNNLDEGTSCGFGAANGSTSGQPARLGPLQDNGGPIATRALLGGSPAIDAGDPAACPATDQRGIPRPQGLRCDIGAYEVSPPNPAPTITGLATTPSPVVAGAGGTVALTVGGTNFVSGFSTIAIDGTPVATTYVSGTQLTATLPAFPRTGAGAYTVTVTTSAPGGGTSNPLTLTAQNPAPTLAGTGTPGVLAGSGNTTLTLSGTGFAPGATVQFGGTTLTPTAANIAATTIAVTVPANLLTTARVAQVAVTNPGPGGGTSGSVGFTVANAAPTLTDSSPTTATAGQGNTPLTVTGTGFVPGSTIAVGGQTLATTVTSATSASATIPAATLHAAGNLAITVTVPGPGGGTVGGRTLVVNPADAAQLTVSAGSPQSAAVTTTFLTGLAVTVRDQYGNPVADGTVVTFAVPASGPSGTFVGGATTATATTTGGVTPALAFTANGVVGAYSVIASAGGGAVPFALTNTPGPTDHFAVTAPATSAAGAPLGLTVTARDAQGNLATGYTGTIHFTSADPQATLPADYTFVAGDGGTKAFGATLRTAGQQPIAATDTLSAGVGGTTTVTVAPAAPASLTATGGTPQSRAIGQAFAPLAATVRDAFGNPVPGVAVTFAAPSTGASATFPGGGASATVATGADGVATAPATTANSVVGAYTVVASGPGGSATFALTNTPGPATRLVATTAATGPVRAGDPVAFGVTALDAGGNVTTGYRGTLHLTSGDAAATLPGDYAFTAGDAGTHSFSATLRTGGAQTVTATDTTNSALTASATIQVAAPSTATVTTSTSGGGTVSPSGATSYTVGSTATYAAAPAAGQVFVGWTLDGQYVGYASPLTFTVSANRTLVAAFVARPSFGDVPPSDPDYQAITTLAALGIINPGGVNGSGQFQPSRAVARAEVAAFIARLFGWENEFHGNSFPDKCDPTGAQGCVDDKLWNDVAALKDYGVVGGYTDPATCTGAGTTAPCYLPRDQVLKLQVVSIVARAFTRTPDLRPTGFWDRLAADPAQYTNVPDAGSQRSDLTTYRANAGTLPGQANDGTFPAPNDPATRRFIIEVLWQAYSAQFGTDRVP